VVDDASTDDTEAVVKEFGDARIRYAAHLENRGGSAARNTGIRLSQGEYVAFLDSDDEWLPDKTSHQLKVLQEAPRDVGLVYSDFVRVYPSGRQERNHPVSRGISVGYPSTWLVRREVFQCVGGFDETMPAMQDTEISIRIRQAWTALHDPVVVTRYHVTGDSISRSASNSMAAASLLIERYADVVTKDELSHWYMLLGKASMIGGQVGRGRRSLVRAAYLCPFKLRHYGALMASMLGGRAYSILRSARRGIALGGRRG
jgi:glycosyltransferase involved in cell wall biosynthesis